LRACCAVQAPSGWAVAPRMCTRRFAASIDEQHVQACEEDRVHVEEIAGQQAVGVGAEECPPGAVQSAGSPAVTAAHWRPGVRDQLRAGPVGDGPGGCGPGW
jgi:hypothetical protein